MRMKRHWVLVAAAARRLRAQQFRQLQQPTWCAPGAKPNDAGTRPVTEIIEHHAETGLTDATGQFFQRRFFLRRDVAEKGQRQVQIGGRDRPTGFRRGRRMASNWWRRSAAMAARSSIPSAWAGVTRSG